MTQKKNRKFEVKQLNIFKEIEKKLYLFFQGQTSLITKSAKEDSANPPSKAVSIFTYPEIIRLRHACSKFLSSTAKEVKGYLEIILTNFQLADNKQPVHEEKINELHQEKEAEIARLETEGNTKDELLQQGESEVRNELKTLKLDLENMPKYNLFWSCFISIFVACGISFSEVAYTAKAFELTGLTYYERYLVAIGIGLSTVFIGVGFIEILRSQWKNYWKILGATSSFLLIGGVYFTLGKIRVDLLKQEMASGIEFSDLSAFDFLLINLIFFVAIVLIHWILWPAKNKFSENSEHRKKQDQVTRKKNELKSVQKQRLNLPNELSRERKKVLDKYDKNVAALLKEYAEQETERTDNQTNFNNIYGRLIELYDELNFFHKESVGLYIATINKYRTDGIFLTIDEPLDDLPNPFKNFKYLDDSITDSEISKEIETNINLDFEEILNISK